MSPSSSIIDLHTHPVFMGEGRRPDELESLVSSSQAQGIVKMNALGDVLLYGPNPDDGQLKKINDENGQLQLSYPEFFTSFCYLNPTLGERLVMQEAERCLSRYGSRGIKLEIANNASAACMKHVARAARTFGLPILQHTWSTMGSFPADVPRKLQSDPVDTATFARRNPDVHVIMAHLSGFGIRGIAEVKDLPNVSIDTSGGYPEAGLVEYAVQQLGAERVYYGSDHPIREHSVTVGRILGADISEKDRRKILYLNAARLLGLS